MRFSIWPNLAQPWADVVAVARHAEATGWDRVYVADHFMADGETATDPSPTEVLEATAALASLAVATERVRLGSLVLGVTYRHPAVLANWAATVDHASGGRLVLGLGAGWQENEHEQYGITLGPRGARIARFEEACTIITSLLTERSTTFDGNYYQLHGALCEPKPVQPRLPLLIGGKGNRMMGLVARHAEEWNTWGLPDAIAERRAALDQRCEAIGRDPREIATSCQARWYFDDDQRAADELVAASAMPSIGGPIRRLTDFVAAWRDAGVEEIIVPDFSLGSGSSKTDRMDAIIEQVAPQFR